MLEDPLQTTHVSTMRLLYALVVVEAACTIVFAQMEASHTVLKTKNQTVEVPTLMMALQVIITALQTGLFPLAVIHLSRIGRVSSSLICKDLPHLLPISSIRCTLPLQMYLVWVLLPELQLLLRLLPGMRLLRTSCLL